METVVRGLVVYDLSGSALAIALINASRSAPGILFGFVGGVAADRVDRRILLMISQSSTAICGATLGVLIISGTIQWWHFVVAAVVEGTGGGFQMPARQALLATLVPREHLVNAIALNSGTNRIARIVGPAAAGLLAGAFGPAIALFMEAGLYSFAAVCSSRVNTGAQLGSVEARPRSGSAARLPGGEQTWVASMREGFQGYGQVFKVNPVLGWLMVLALIPSIFSFGGQIMAPVFAKDILGIGPSGIGLLLAAPGVGSLIAIVFLAWFGDMRRKGLRSMIGVGLLGGAAIIYGLSHWLWLSLAALALQGFAMATYQTMNQTLLQLNSPDEYRGRVMAVYHSDRAVSPLISIMIGTLSDTVGPQATMVFTGIGNIVTVLLVGMASKKARDLD